MTNDLIGGLLFGASLGVGVTVCVVMWWHWRCWERATNAALIHEARRCLDDLVGDGQAEILALFRARAALFELARLMGCDSEEKNLQTTAAAQAPALPSTTIPAELLEVGAPGTWNGI